MLLGARSPFPLVRAAVCAARVRPAFHGCGGTRVSVPGRNESLPSSPRLTLMKSTYGAHTVHAASGGQTAGDLAIVRALTTAGVKITLGSKSFTRKSILTEMGLPYEIEVAGIDEKAIRFEDPNQLVTALALAKADAIRKIIKNDNESQKYNTFLITCDQVVVYDGTIREKPHDETQARAFIKSYGKKPVSTVGSIAVTDLATGAVFSANDTSTICFSNIPDSVIDDLITEGTCLQCAGGLMVEHPLLVPLTLSIDGTMDGLMGLNKKVLGKLLEDALDARSSS